MELYRRTPQENTLVPTLSHTPLNKRMKCSTHKIVHLLIKIKTILEINTTQMCVPACNINKRKQP
jgi:hypothetical protein